MKKFVLAFVIVATLVVALATTGYVFAQSGNPPTPQTPGSGYGYGRGMIGRGTGIANGGEGILHDTLIAVFAQKLGLTVDELNTRLAKGESMAQIAASKGLTAEQFAALMTDARNQAIDQAVKDGKLTQAQADWMKTRGSAMNGAIGNGATFGSRGGMMGAGRSRGMRGNGAGNPSTGPYFPQTNQ